MPAMLDDPTSPPILHTINPSAHSLPPAHVTLKDGTSRATILPFTSLSSVPAPLVAFLHAQLCAEIEQGDTYPMVDALPLDKFGPYWFGVFGAVMLHGEHAHIDDVARLDPDWEKLCLGSFYIKPNYPGRSSHVCNAGFLVTGAARNKGVGKLLGRQYLEWAPKLVSMCYDVWGRRVDLCRVLRIRCLILCMRRMWRRRGFGIPWGLRELGG